MFPNFDYMSNPIERAELVERLKKLGESEPPSGFAPGAMCFVPYPLYRCCPKCGQVSCDYHSKIVNTYRGYVKELRKYGLDITLLPLNFCLLCGLPLKGEKFQLEIKYPDQPESYRIELKDSRDLVIMERFLQGVDRYDVEQNGEGALVDSTNRLAELFGIVAVLRNAAEEGDAEAQYVFGLHYANNKDESMKWIHKAAEQGHREAQFCLGGFFYDGDCRGYLPFENYSLENEIKAVKWYRKAAEQGHAEACYQLGECYLFGEPQDKDAAVKWYHVAAERGYVHALFKLGLYYYLGDNIPQDTAKAVECFREAASRGDEMAAERLREIEK
jgi:hypothetical protein